MDRRDFLERASAISGLAAHLLQTPAEAASSDAARVEGTDGGQNPAAGEMIYRPLGRTGEKVSAIGLGGFHIGTQKDEQESIRIIRSAIDRGITFMDNCWDYHAGGVPPLCAQSADLDRHYRH